MLMNVSMGLVSVNKGVSILRVAITVNVGMDTDTLMSHTVKVFDDDW